MALIKVKRDKDGKVFTSDMSKDTCIVEINFCEAHTRVHVLERTEFGLKDKEIFCHAVGVIGTVDNLDPESYDLGRLFVVNEKVE